MPNDPVVQPPSSRVRWILTGCLLILAALCVGRIVSLKALKNSGHIISAVNLEEALMGPIAALDVLAILGLSVWVLRPPVQGALGFYGSWLGKVLLFLTLAAAIVIIFFATCMVVPVL